jgi:hypothetical protein
MTRFFLDFGVQALFLRVRKVRWGDAAAHLQFHCRFGYIAWRSLMKTWSTAGSVGMASDAANLQALVDPTCERPWWSGQNFTFGCKFGPEPILIFVVISGFAAEHDGHIVLLPRIICHAFYRREFKGVVFFTMTVVVRPATKISDPKVTRISPCGGSPTYGKARTAFSPTNFWSSNTCQTTKANATLSASPKS